MVRVGEITCLCTDGGERPRLYVGSAWDGLWRLDNVVGFPGGATWTPLSGPDGPRGIAAVASAPSERQRLYVAETGGRTFRSDNAGETWTELPNGPVGSVRRILVHEQDPDRVLIAASARAPSDDNGLWLSTDGGENWALVLDGDIEDAALGLEPGHVVLAAVRGVGVRRSTNGGGNWEPTLSFVSAEAHGGPRMSLAVGPASDDRGETVVVGFGEELFFNPDGGRGPGSLPAGHWFSLGRAASPLTSGASAVLAFDPFEASTLLAGSDELRVNTRFPARGESAWTTALAERPCCVAFDGNVSGLVVVATEHSLLRSLDHGVTWTDIGHGLAIHDVTELSVEGRTGLARTGVGGVVHSGDVLAGRFRLLHDVEPGSDLVVGDPRRPGTYYLLGEQLRRLRVGDGGASEVDDSWGAFRPYSATPGELDTVALLVGTDDRVLRLRSENYGDDPTWDDPGEGWSDSPIAQIATSATEPRAAVALSATGGVYRADKTDLRGWEAWETVGDEGPRQVRSLVLNSMMPDRMYAIAGGAIWRSSDGGANWEALTDTEAAWGPTVGPHALLAHPRNGRVLFAGTPVGVFISTDEGGSWRAYNHDLPAAPVSGLAWASDDLLVSISDSGLWRRHPKL